MAVSHREFLKIPRAVRAAKGRALAARFRELTVNEWAASGAVKWIGCLLDLGRVPKLLTDREITASTTLSGWPRIGKMRYKRVAFEHSPQPLIYQICGAALAKSSSQLGIEQQVEATVSWMRAVAPKTVLCVDDEKVGLRVRKIMLESHGFRVLTANSGEQGLTMFDDNEVDLVVLDYYMPGLNGGDVAAELRRRRPDVPIIFLSAYFSLPPAALELANAFITKGDPPDVLIKKIEQLV